MVPVPKLRPFEKTEGYLLVERFCTSPFWEEEYDDLFAPNLVVDFPHAPPGMLQHLTAFEFSAFRYWLRNTVRKMETVGGITIIPTTDPDIFWAIRMCAGEVYWAKKECKYENEHAILLHVRDGKLTYIKDYFNPIKFYDAMGIILPAYIFDPEDEPKAINRMPEGAVSRFSEEENVRRAVMNFANPIEFDDQGESIYATDVELVCPQVPYSMPELFVGKEFDTQTDWMFVACPEWNTTPESATLYLTPDPNIIIVESIGYGRTTWSKTDGHYTQRELQICFLENGKVKHFRVYFNPMNKFSSMNQSIPSFPYFNF